MAGPDRRAVRVTPDHTPPGFMTREERKKFENLNSSYNKYWVPCVWFSNLAAQARREGRIRDNSALKLLLEVSLQGNHSFRITEKLCHTSVFQTPLPIHLFPWGQPYSPWYLHPVVHHHQTPCSSWKHSPNICDPLHPRMHT